MHLGPSQMTKDKHTQTMHLKPMKYPTTILQATTMNLDTIK